MSHQSNSQVLTYLAAIIRTTFHLQSTAVKTFLLAQIFGGNSQSLKQKEMFFGMEINGYFKKNLNFEKISQRDIMKAKINHDLP